MAGGKTTAKTEDNGQGRFRKDPDKVVLPVRAGVEPSDKPPVRIFLGTEDAQHRAERIFFYSIEQVRDPARVYEIYLMKNIAGFDRSKWRTGFTQYRFAIPDFAGRDGKAIYNDVDQIYLADPAKLFDLDIDGHGYRAVSSEDTSVMVLDCARMAQWWNREAASTGAKHELILGPARQDGLWGELDGGWNARDMEYVDGKSMLLHYTALHMQPWHPFPEAYSYHEHPLGEVWYRLERQADAEGYQVFSADRPSPRFESAVGRNEDRDSASRDLLPSDPARAFMGGYGPRSLLLPTVDEARAQSIAARFGVDEIHAFRPVGKSAWPSGTFDAAAAIGLLENVPGEDVPWILEEIFRRAEQAVYLAIETGEPPAREANIDVERCIRPLEWWHARIAEAASRHPHVAWHLDAVAPDGDRVETLAGEPVEANGDGRTVWVLEGKRKGDNAQLHRLADALGWHKQTKAMRFTKAHVTPGFLLGASLANLTPHSRQQLKAPWPDVVIAAGKRSAATARWICQQSGGKTRLVHVGRPWMRLDAFDLIVTTPQYRLPARPNVLHNALPLTPVTEEALAAARKEAAIDAELKELPEPRIALLVGGDSWSYKLDAHAARALGQSADTLAQQMGGSLMITTSPRTRREAADALLAAITVPHVAHVWTPDAAFNPYLAYLAMADEVMVTGDSASLLADACATGKPVSIFELPLRLHAGALAAPFRAFTKWRQGISSYRGTPRQQDGLSRFYDGLVDRGLITPARDLRRLHEFAAIRGLAHLVGSADKAHMKVPRHDLERAVSRVRRLFTDGRRV